MSERTIRNLSIALFLGALLWGGYTFLVYIGMPIHGLVYLSSEQVSALETSCGTSAEITTYLCRGISGVTTFISRTLQMGSPFLSYAIISLLLYLAFSVYTGFKTGYFSLRVTLRPLHLIILFALSVWLIATTLSLTTLSNATASERMQFRRFYEPTAEAYNNVKSEETMAELKANYASLLERGCLKELGATQQGTRIYQMSEWCVQQSIFARVGGQFVMLLAFLLNLLVAGRLLLSLLRLRNEHPLLELCMALGLGSLLWVMALWLLAIMGQLHTKVAWALFIGLPILAFPHTLYWLKSVWQRKWSLDLPFAHITILLGWLLVSYLTLNFLNVVRPFPIGWDDLGSYLNRPRLLASYGSFIPSMSQFQWEYLTSLGYVLFGYESWFGATFAMQINWAAGLLAVLVTYAFGRSFFGPRAGLLAAILYYFLPMTGHFSFADMKIDNASYFTSALALFCVFAALFSLPGFRPDRTTQRGNWRLFIVAGLLAGFSFAIKPTALLAVLMAATIIIGEYFSLLGFIGAALFTISFLIYYGTINFREIAQWLNLQSIVPSTVFAAVTAIIAFALLGVSLRRRRAELRPLMVSIGALISALVISVAPWMVYNGWDAHRNGSSLDAGKLLKAEDSTSPQLYFSKEMVPANVKPETIVNVLPPDLGLDQNHPACKTSAKSEELDRYWGFDKGWKHYLTLPWREVMNVDAFGYYVTLSPFLLLLPLLLLLPYFWSSEARWLKLLFGGTMLFLLQWSFVANGIMWYGIAMFLGFALCLEAFTSRPPDLLNRTLLSILITAGILVCLVNRFWQFDSQKNLFEYPLGKISASALREMTIPPYDNIQKSVVERHETMPDRPFTYRIGTFISYFIPRNREILPVADHQLSFFNCLNQERDHALTLKRLQALGFNGMIFDTNTHTIEKDPNGSLHQKVNAFLAFANDPSLNIQALVNDPGNGVAYLLLP